MKPDCEGCNRRMSEQRVTERSLAQAIGIIEQLTKAEQQLSAARAAVRDAELSVMTKRADAMEWLENLK